MKYVVYYTILSHVMVVHAASVIHPDCQVKFTYLWNVWKLPSKNGCGHIFSVLPPANWNKSLASLFHLMCAITCTHASTCATSLRHKKKHGPLLTETCFVQEWKYPNFCQNYGFFIRISTSSSPPIIPLMLITFVISYSD